MESDYAVFGLVMWLLVYSGNDVNAWTGRDCACTRNSQFLNLPQRIITREAFGGRALHTRYQSLLYDCLLVIYYTRVNHKSVIMSLRLIWWTIQCILRALIFNILIITFIHRIKPVHYGFVYLPVSRVWTFWEANLLIQMLFLSQMNVPILVN